MKANCCTDLRNVMSWLLRLKAKGVSYNEILDALEFDENQYPNIEILKAARDMVFKRFTLDYIQGPSHGWIKISGQVVKHFGFSPSAYSYFDHKNNVLYLEEDCDAPRFIKLIESKGYKVTHNNIYDEKESVRRFSRTM